MIVVIGKPISTYARKLTIEWWEIWRVIHRISPCYRKLMLIFHVAIKLVARIIAFLEATLKLCHKKHLSNVKIRSVVLQIKYPCELQPLLLVVTDSVEQNDSILTILKSAYFTVFCELFTFWLVFRWDYQNSSVVNYVQNRTRAVPLTKITWSDGYLCRMSALMQIVPIISLIEKNRYLRKYPRIKIGITRMKNDE